MYIYEYPSQFGLEPITPRRGKAMTNKLFLTIVVVSTFIAAFLGGMVGWAIGSGQLPADYFLPWAIASTGGLAIVHGFAALYRANAVKTSMWWALAVLVPYVNLFAIAHLGGAQKEGDWWY
jgi:hypothetical protein